MTNLVLTVPLTLLIDVELDAEETEILSWDMTPGMLDGVNTFIGIAEPHVIAALKQSKLDGTGEFKVDMSSMLNELREAIENRPVLDRSPPGEAKSAETEPVPKPVEALPSDTNPEDGEKETRFYMPASTSTKVH